MLETTECIPIKNNGRDYTDCMEFSLLRFAHIIFYSEKQIEKEGSSDWILNPKNNIIKISHDLKTWINQHPKIYPNSSYYLEKDGLKEREEWAQFISDRPYFDYYRTDGAELFTSVKNIIIFCKEMLGMDLDIDEYEEENIIKIISNIINKYTGKQFKFYIELEETRTINTPHENIIKLISKPQPDIFSLKKQSYKVINKKSILHIVVDEEIYNWDLYEVYFANKENVSNKFITGHSVING